MKYEIRIVKLGFLGKDKIDIEEFAKEGGFLYGIFDEFGVLEKNRCEENSAFFYTNKNAGHGVFFRNQTNEKTRSAEVLLTVNERMTKKEYYSDSFFMEKMVETVKKFFHAVKIYENDRLITEEMLEDGRYFGRSQSEYEEIWKSDFYEFAENTKDGFVQGPLFPLFIDEDNLNSFQCYTNQVYPMAEYDHQYVNREYFIDDNTDKKVIRWFLEENRSAVMPVDLRTIKEHWGTSAVISINGKDYPYDLTVDVMKSNYDVQNYDRRQIQHPKFSKVQLKRIAETVEKRLKTDQFPDFNFKLVVISNIVHKNPDFKEKLEDVYDYAKRYSSYSKDFIDSNVVEILKEIVLTKKDLAKVTHLCLSRENDFFFEIKPNWSGEDSLFDIESFQGIELLENLDTYFFDGELCNPNLQEKLCDFGEVFDKNDDHDKTDYAEESDEDEDDWDDEDEEDDDSDDEDDEADEEAEELSQANHLFNAYRPALNLSLSEEEKSFVREMIEKYCPEYDPDDNAKNNRIGVMMLHYNGCCLSQGTMTRETVIMGMKSCFTGDYVKNYLPDYDPINMLVEQNEEYRKLYHIFPDDDEPEEDSGAPVSLLDAYQPALDLSSTEEEKKFLRELIEKYCPEYDPSDNKKNNRIGVMMLYFNGSSMKNASREDRAFSIQAMLQTGYAKNYGPNFEMLNSLIEETEEYRRKFHIFPEDDCTENSDDAVFDKVLKSLEALKMTKVKEQIADMKRSSGNEEKQFVKQFTMSVRNFDEFDSEEADKAGILFLATNGKLMSSGIDSPEARRWFLQNIAGNEDSLKTEMKEYDAAYNLIKSIEELRNILFLFS